MILICVLCILVLIVLIYTPPIGRIPRIIWTYWDGDDTDNIIKKCIHTWHKTGYEIRFINRSNIQRYIPDVDIANLKCIDGPARISDFVRLFVLYRYGGVWCDASIILTENLSWVNEKFKNPDVQLFAHHSIDENKDEELFIESWFLAAPQYSPLVKLWLDEFLAACEYPSLDEYIKECNENNITLKDADFEFMKYLTVYICLKKVLKKHGTKHISTEHHGQLHFYKNIDMYCTESKLPKHILKLRGGERKQLIDDTQLQQCIFS